MNTPIVILDGGVAYRLQFGTLLSCEVTKRGVVEGISEPLCWCQVESFALEPGIQAQINEAFSILIGADTEQSLCAEYRAYCVDEKLPMLSADEQAFTSLTHDQAVYMDRFTARWDRVTNALDHNAWLRSNDLRHA